MIFFALDILVWITGDLFGIGMSHFGIIWPV